MDIDDAITAGKLREGPDSVSCSCCRLGTSPLGEQVTLCPSWERVMLDHRRRNP
jgi:hypothetical protein